MDNGTRTDRAWLDTGQCTLYTNPSLYHQPPQHVRTVFRPFSRILLEQTVIAERAYFTAMEGDPLTDNKDRKVCASIGRYANAWYVGHDMRPIAVSGAHNWSFSSIG